MALGGYLQGDGHVERLRRRPLSAYVVVVGLVAIAGLYDDLRSPTGGRLIGPSPALAAVMLCCALGASIWSIQHRERSGTGEVTGTWAFLGALVLLVPPVTAAAIAGGVAAIAAIARRKEPIAVWFNAATLVVSVSVAESIVRLDPGQARVPWTAHPGSGWFVLVFGALLAAFVTNVVVIAVGIAIDSRLPVRDVVAAHFSEAVLLEVTLLTLAPVLVVAGRRTAFLLPPLLGAIAVVIHMGSQSLRRRHDANHDALTGLANRRLFDLRLRATLQSLGPLGTAAVVLADLDGFKGINDTHGHDWGDRVLVAVAERMLGACRPCDVVARIGGDEFAVVLPGATREVASEVVERLREAIASPIELGDGATVTVGASAGMAVAPLDGSSPLDLLRVADDSMYESKLKAGPSEVPSGSQHPGVDRVGDLARTLGSGELFLEYQPVVAVGDSRLVGVEALVRWQHPAAGVVPPAAFLPALERSGSLSVVTEWVLREAIRQGAEWEAAGRRLRVGVNVSTRDLADRRFPGLVRRVLTSGGLDPSLLVLELTGGSALIDDQASHGLARLGELGIGVAIDDFGPGAAAVGRLRHLPVCQVKLDRRLVSSLGRECRDVRVLDALLELADALGLDTVAVGVEDEQAVRLLRGTLCDEAQGFVFAPPMGAAALGAWIGGRSGERTPAVGSVSLSGLVHPER